MDFDNKETDTNPEILFSIYNNEPIEQELVGLLKRFNEMLARILQQ